MTYQKVRIFVTTVTKTIPSGSIMPPKLLHPKRFST